MELWQELLKEILGKEEIEISFPNLKLNIKELVEINCYRALQSIKAILDDSSLTDGECFEKIEQIVALFEHLGSGSSRHDFG
ncbi:MAG: hypothetical protein RSD48_08240 [Oscillospiraceae bacterium]